MILAFMPALLVRTTAATGLPSRTPNTSWWASAAKAAGEAHRSERQSADTNRNFISLSLPLGTQRPSLSAVPQRQREVTAHRIVADREAAVLARQHLRAGEGGRRSLLVE